MVPYKGGGRIVAKTMKQLAAIFVALTVVFVVLHGKIQAGVWLSLAITFGTISYHICVRLLVGLLYNVFMKNRADYGKKWYQVGEREQKLYELLRVKRWKGKMPAYHAEMFDPAVYSWDEIAQAMCQSELVHETNVVVSFVPLVFSVWFGAFYVFLITSILAAGMDLLFVFMQRYNRPRLVRLIKRRAEKQP